MLKNLLINGITYVGLDAVKVPTDSGETALFCDTSDTTVAPETLIEGVTARNADGELIVGEAAPKYVENAVTVAQFGNVTYKSVQKALDVAAEAGGGTVTLIANATEGEVTIPSGVTLDLAGFTLTADSVTGMTGSHLIDNSSSNDGKLIAPMNDVRLSSSNSQLPLWDEDGYRFVVIEVTTNLAVSDDEATYRFYISKQDDNMLFSTLLADNGASDHMVSVKARTKNTESAGTTTITDYTFPDRNIINIATADKAGQYGIYIITIPVSADKEYTFSVVIQSSTGVEKEWVTE